MAERAAQAAQRGGQARKKKGQTISPVIIEGRKIATTFWGKAWCDNLERYSDFANRLPRGRTYVRNGSVVDLQIAPGKVKALVSGSELYEVEVKVAPLAEERAGKPSAATARARSIRWSSFCRDGSRRASWSGSAGRRRACSRRRGDRAFVQLPRLGRDVQARGGRALRHRRPARPAARAPLPAA